MRYVNTNEQLAETARKVHLPFRREMTACNLFTSAEQANRASVRSISQVVLSQPHESPFFKIISTSSLARRPKSQHAEALSLSFAGSHLVGSSPSQHDAVSNPLPNTGGECPVSANEKLRPKSHAIYCARSGERVSARPLSMRLCGSHSFDVGIVKDLLFKAGKTQDLKLFWPEASLRCKNTDCVKLNSFLGTTCSDQQLIHVPAIDGTLKCTSSETSFHLLLLEL